MSSPRRRAEGTQNVSLETRIMDLWDAGRSREQIIAITGEPQHRVERVLHYMREGDSEVFARRGIVAGSAALIAAIARHHPERVWPERVRS